jgi:protein farnesyltransferase subunit beta
MDETETERQQRELEQLIREECLLSGDSRDLDRHKHIRFVQSGLAGLSSRFVSLDASQPWLCYWMLHALALLGRPTEQLSDRTIQTLRQCQHSKGGYGGGFGQLAHLAPSYAAVNALVTIGTREAFQSIDR